MSGCITAVGPYGCRQFAASGPALDSVGLTSSVPLGLGGPKWTHYIFLSLPAGPDIAFNTAQGKHMSSSLALINKMWLD